MSRSTCDIISTLNDPSFLNQLQALNAIIRNYQTSYLDVLNLLNDLPENQFELVQSNCSKYKLPDDITESTKAKRIQDCQKYKGQVMQLVDLRSKFDGNLGRILSGKHYSAWKILDSCLFDFDTKIPAEDLDPLKKLGKGTGQFPRKFNEMDLQQERECESRIHF